MNLEATERHFDGVGMRAGILFYFFGYLLPHLYLGKVL